MNFTPDSVCSGIKNMIISGCAGKVVHARKVFPGVNDMLMVYTLRR